MENKISFYQYLAGIGTGVVVTGISSLILWNTPQFWESIGWQALILIALFTLGNARHKSVTQGLPSSRETLSFWALLPLVFIVSWRVSVDVYFIYTIIWSAYAPFYMSWKRCWYWIIAISIGWYLVRYFAWEESHPLAGALLVATFHAFALLSARAAQTAEQANEKTQKLNRELLATQHLLSESSRERERTRIARDLHDLLGHHLTALTINLQVASHLTEGEAKEKVDQCHGLAKLLLSDVREAVATLRQMPVVNLKELIEIAVQDIPRLTICIDVDKNIVLENVDTAEVLLRIVQESITNTLKHSTANSASIEVCVEASMIKLVYSDSGQGCAQLVPGHGLQGMRERIERIGGELHIVPNPSFRIIARVPQAG